MSQNSQKSAIVAALLKVNSSDSCSPCAGSPASTPAYISLYAAAAAVVLLTVCGNLLVVASVCHFKQLHTPTNVLILSLAFSDLLVGLFVMPLQFTWLIESCWIFGQSVCLFYSFASFHLSSSSVHNVALIAMDRYFALNNPFFYSKQVSVKLSVIVASLNWAVSFIYNFALLYFNDFFTVLLAVCPGDCPAAAGKIWSVVDFVVVFVLPCSLMCILYIRIFTIVKRHIKRINIQRDNHNNGDVRRSERKAAKVLGIVVSVFLLCLVPYYICSFMSGATHYLPFDELINYTMALFYLNSSVNPVIYALFYPWFQKCIKLLLSHHICRADSSLIKVK